MNCGLHTTKFGIICTDRDTETVPEMLQVNSIYTAMHHCMQLSLHDGTSAAQ